MGRFKGRLRCEGRVNFVITNVITLINYGCNDMFFKYKYNVKTCMYTRKSF